MTNLWNTFWTLALFAGIVAALVLTGWAFRDERPLRTPGTPLDWHEDPHLWSRTRIIR